MSNFASNQNRIKTSLSHDTRNITNLGHSQYRTVFKAPFPQMQDDNDHLLSEEEDMSIVLGWPSMPIVLEDGTDLRSLVDSIAKSPIGSVSTRPVSFAPADPFPSTLETHTLKPQPSTLTHYGLSEKLPSREQQPQIAGFESLELDNANSRPTSVAHSGTSGEHPPLGSHAIMSSPGRGAAEAFPEKLHNLIRKLSEDGYENIISWQPHGRCFRIHKQDDFIRQIFPV
jgi:hypothetical protein